MDRKKALELVNSLIAEHKASELTQVLTDVRNEINAIKKKTHDPLVKAIQDVQESLTKTDLEKIDPRTKLPGTLLDKKGDNFAVGSSQRNLTPGQAMTKFTPSMSQPHSPKMTMNKDKLNKMAKDLKKALAAKSMYKTEGEMSVQEAVDKILHDKWEVQDVLPKVPKHLQDDVLKKLRELKQDDYPHQSVHGYDKDVKKSEQLAKPAPKGVSKEKYDSCVDQVKDRNGGKNPYAICAASLKKKVEKSDQVRPDAGFGSVTVKDTAPKSYGKVTMKADNPKIKQIFALFSKKKSKMDMEKAEDKPKEMSAGAKKAIEMAEDKPFKIQPERPGQANKPTEET